MTVMEPIDRIYVNIIAAFDTDMIAFKATSEPKLMHESTKDTPMQTSIACKGWSCLTCMIQDEKGRPPSLFFEAVVSMWT